MHNQPVLLRRTGSALPSRAGSAAPGSSGGQVVDPGAAIPIADADPGLDLSASRRDSHKRKQSGIPMDAEAIRASGSSRMTLDQIADDEDGSSYSDAESPLASPTDMPEMAEWSLDGADGAARSPLGALRAAATSRGAVGAVLAMMALAFAATRSASSTAATHDLAPPPAGGADAEGADVPAAEADSPKLARPDVAAKGTTDGEDHAVSVGTPMEHTVHEYNNVRFFDHPDIMDPLHSKGPVLWDDDVGGLHLFEDVCLTTNVAAQHRHNDPDTSPRGLIYFTDDERAAGNPRRCVPCSATPPLGEWDAAHGDRQVVRHECGMNGLHAMFATSVGDWSSCVQEEENAALIEEKGQEQSPTNVTTIHFFQDPTFLLQFNRMDMEASLFDTLLTYLPHWHNFMGDAGGDGFPFNSVISHSLEGCLSHSHNWFCEILHQMYAFGGETKEIPWEADSNTLYCYRELFYNQLGYQRNLDHEGLVTRENFGEFREMLFRKFGLPRRRTVEDRLADLEYDKAHAVKKQARDSVGQEDEGRDNDSSDGTTVILYDNKLSEHAVWNEMESLVTKARELEKYQQIKFVTVKRDFNELTVAQQARLFNEADAVVMAHGPHMANVIFAVDGTSFVEVGCRVESLIANPRFIALMDGKYRSVEQCDGEAEEGAVCVMCSEEKEVGEKTQFTMSLAAFEQLIDDVVSGLAE